MKNILEIRGGYSNTGIVDLDTSEGLVPRETDTNGPAFRSVFHRVIQQVVDDVLQAVRITEHREGAIQLIDTDFQIFFLDLLLPLAQALVNDGLPVHRYKLQGILLRLDAREAEEIHDDMTQTIDVKFDLLQETHIVRLVFNRTAQQGFDVAAHRCQRSLELVGNVRDKVATNRLEPTHVRHVMKNKDNPAKVLVCKRRRLNLEGAFPAQVGKVNLPSHGRIVIPCARDEVNHVQNAGNILYSLATDISDTDELARGLVAKQNFSVVIDSEDPFDHSREHRP